jgi:lantibiotic modifying enzyme
MSTNAACLGAADNIARYLCRTALQWQDRVTWMTTTQSADGDSDLVLRYESAGPDLYQGTSGIALFLAEMYRHSRTKSYRDIALAAMEQTFERSASVVQGRLGFYSGWSGIAFAAARVAFACDHEPLRHRAVALLDPLTRSKASLREWDVISGAAGAIPALLGLGKDLGQPAFVETAFQLGRELVRHTSTWYSRSDEDEVNIVPVDGFAHGTAGPSWAFAELHGEFANASFRDAALRCAVFSQHGGFEMAIPWCSGSAGIGLSRSRVWEITRDERSLADAMHAIAKCKRALRELQALDRFDYSLCHGRAGACDLLLHASALLGDTESETLVRDVALRAARTFGETPDAWPSGVTRGPNPTLMLGSAGVGYFLLRVVDRAIPSVLLPTVRRLPP